MTIPMMATIGDPPHLKSVSGRISIVPIIPIATPMILIIRERNARIFPIRSNTNLFVPFVAAEIQKNIIEIPEIIHAKVTNARAAKIFPQTSFSSFSLSGHL